MLRKGRRKPCIEAVTFDVWGARNARFRDIVPDATITSLGMIREFIKQLEA